MFYFEMLSFAVRNVLRFVVDEMKGRRELKHCERHERHWLSPDSP